jgi:hypothetical protein
LVFAPILIWHDFTKAFILNVDWSTRRVRVILSQKDGKNEHFFAYVTKGFSPIQKKFHPMEGECYVLVWGIVHFSQYLYQNYFTLRTNHKSLEWLATVSNANGKKGRWINTL